MDVEKRAMGNAFELILTVCGGARKSPATNDTDIGYNNALGDIFDYIIKNESDVLLPATVKLGLWTRDENISNKSEEPETPVITSDDIVKVKTLIDRIRQTNTIDVLANSIQELNERASILNMDVKDYIAVNLASWNSLTCY